MTVFVRAPMAGSWVDQAACRSYPHDSDDFFAGGGACERARRFCAAECPVVDLCLWATLSLEDWTHRHGVFGATLPSERHAMQVGQEEAQAVYEDLLRRYRAASAVEVDEAEHYRQRGTWYE